LKARGVQGSPWGHRGVTAGPLEVVLRAGRCQPKPDRAKLEGRRYEALCGVRRGGGDGDELAQDVLGHLDIVLRDEQRLLDVLRGVALATQLLDLATDVGVGRVGAGPVLRVDPPGEGLRRSLRGLRRLREG